jgi:cell division protein FtsA
MTKEELVMIHGIGGARHKEIQKGELCDIIQPRVEELFEICNEEIIKSGFSNALGAGIVLTGGSALLKGVDELAQRIFNVPVRIGYPLGDKYLGLASEIESPKYSTAMGLALHSLNIANMDTEIQKTKDEEKIIDTKNIDNKDEQNNGNVEGSNDENSSFKSVIKKIGNFFNDL